MLKFAILDPRPIPVAKEANEKIFAGGSVFGIEVTIPELAKRCVGNIDPQHTGVDSTKAAIEEAMMTDLPSASTVATVRPDLDSVGAMAIMAIREDCHEYSKHLGHGGFCRGKYLVWEDTTFRSFISFLRQETIGRIRLIAESDKFAKGGWSGVRPLPTIEKPFDNSTASAESDSRLAPMSAVVSDFKLQVSERVELLIKWLLTGEEPAGYRERWIAERIALAKAVADGTIKTEVVAGGELVKVVSTHRAATSVGYCLAPIVVALNPSFQLGAGEPHRKFTICQFVLGYIDLKKILAELSGLEAGWGGSPTIGGSPQGVSSALTIDEVASVVERHLLK